MKSLNPAKPWGSKDFFSGVGYHPITWRAMSRNLSLWLYYLGLLPQNEQRRTSHFFRYIDTLTILVYELTMTVCGGAKAYNERSLCIVCIVRYRNQRVQTSIYESTPSAQDPMRNKISPGAPEGPGNARANIPRASKERDHRDTSG